MYAVLRASRAMGTVLRRTIAGLAVAVAVAGGVAGCSSAGSHSHSSDAAQTGAGGSAVLAAQPPAGRARNAVSLGFEATPPDGIALVGVQDGLFREDLGAAVALDPVRLASSQSAGLALEQGRIDAAYLDPVSAVRAWQASHGGVRVMAGAASASGRSALVLAVSARFLALHTSWMQGLLKGQVQAMRLLDADPRSGRQMAAAELTALGQRTSPPQFARASAGLAFSCDPLPASVLAQARRAALAGTLGKVTSLAAMYDLVPVDELLIAAGMRPVSHTAG